MKIDYDSIQNRNEYNDRIDTPQNDSLFLGSELSYSIKKFDPQNKKREQGPLRPKEVDKLVNRLYYNQNSVHNKSKTK